MQGWMTDLNMLLSCFREKMSGRHVTRGARVSRVTHVMSISPQNFNTDEWHVGFIEMSKYGVPVIAEYNGRKIRGSLLVLKRGLGCATSIREFTQPSTIPSRGLH